MRVCHQGSAQAVSLAQSLETMIFDSSSLQLQFPMFKKIVNIIVDMRNLVNKNSAMLNCRSDQWKG